MEIATSFHVYFLNHLAPLQNSHHLCESGDGLLLKTIICMHFCACHVEEALQCKRICRDGVLLIKTQECD